MKKSGNKIFILGLGRAFGGAILFSVPMLMTMEMWWFGFYMDPLRLALFVFLSIPLLTRLSYNGGFEKTEGFLDNVLDAFSVYTVAVIATIVVLFLFVVIGPGMSADEIIGKIAVQSVPASLGAMLSRNQMGETDREERKNASGYLAGLFLFGIGALFLSLGMASTEEIILISYKMSEGHVICLMLLTLLLMHGFIHAVVVKKKAPFPVGTFSFWSVFLRLTIAGYAFILLVTLYVLWTFGRTDNVSLEDMIKMTIVLGFPAALGAGAARLIL